MTKEMTFLDEIRASVSGLGMTCGAGAFIAALPPAKQAAINAALAEGIPTSAIGRTLRKWGYPSAVESAVRHLKHRCACPTT